MLTYLLSMVETPEDKSKVEELYYKYRSLMKYIALKILHNEDMSEDAVSDAFVSLIENLDKIDEVDSNDTKAFVYIVTRCISLNKYNKQKRQATEDIEKFLNKKIDDTDVFEDIFLNDWFIQINNLPSIYKDILELKVYYEMTNKEIAKLLNISTALVRKRLERARNLLKETQKREEINV